MRNKVVTKVVCSNIILLLFNYQFIQIKTINKHY